MASADDFFLLRKFSALSARAILVLQQKIAEREQALENWDIWTMSLPGDNGGCGGISDDAGSPRAQLIKETVPLLQEYCKLDALLTSVNLADSGDADDLVNSFSSVQSRPTARRRQMRNLENWFATYPHAINSDEERSMLQEGDMFSMVSRLKTPLWLGAERWQWLRSLFRLTGKRKDRVDSIATLYHSNRGFEAFSTALVILCGLASLIGPLWWLNFVTQSTKRLGIITGFVCLFTTLLWSAAGHRPFEILGATAAYAAVLMIFMQINVSIET